MDDEELWQDSEGETLAIKICTSDAPYLRPVISFLLLLFLFFSFLFFSFLFFSFLFFSFLFFFPSQSDPQQIKNKQMALHNSSRRITVPKTATVGETFEIFSRKLTFGLPPEVSFSPPFFISLFPLSFLLHPFLTFSPYFYSQKTLLWMD